MVQFLAGFTENSISVDPTKLHNDTIAFYSQISVVVRSKAIVEQDFSLYGLELAWGSLHQGSVNELGANPDSQYVFEQISWGLKGGACEWSED